MGGQRIVEKIRCIVVKKSRCIVVAKIFVPVWIRSAVLHARFRLQAANIHIYCTLETGKP